MARFKARQPISWFVLLALFFATLAPSLGTAMGGQSRTVWAQLCNAEGHELVAIQVDGDPPSSHDAGVHQGHCLLCVHPSTTPQLSSVTPAPCAAVVLHIARVETEPAQDASPWNLPLARAPPIIS